MARQPVGICPVLLAACASLAVLVCARSQPPGRDAALARHRNLGKAFYENPATAQHAVAEFKAALELSPGSPRDRLNYGLALLRAGKSGEGAAELREVQRVDPKLPHTWFNLGIYYKQAGDYEKATRQFEQFAALAPREPV